MMAAAERFGVQVPRARWEKCSKCRRSRARSGQLQHRVGRHVESLDMTKVTHLAKTILLRQLAQQLLDCRVVDF